MRLANKVFFITLLALMMSLIVSAQTRRSEEDPRNIAPTVGTGGPMGGPTGLFTVYDGQTLRRGEYTFSIAYSNFDRDPGNADFTEVPISFQVGLNDYVELFFNTDAYRAIKVNSPRNLSGFSLPNAQLRLQNQNGTFTFQSAPAIVLAPGTGTGAIFRPQGSQPLVPYPFIAGTTGGFGIIRPGVGIFGFPVGTNPAISVRSGTGNGADLFPGIGSPVGGILPGIVLQTSVLTGQAAFGIPNNASLTTANSFTIAPSYLPDAPFVSRQYSESAFNTFTVGGKFRFTGPNNPVGIGLIPFYRYYADNANSTRGFNQLSRGASPGGNRGDIGLVAFADGRLARWANLSGNIGYIYNSSVKADFPGASDVTLLDRPDELLAAIGADFPVNRYFQLIGEARATKYVGGRTPNAFENDPIDLLGGVRVFPARWMGFGAWYRYHANQQDRDAFEDARFNTTTTVGTTTTTTTTTGQPPAGFLTSADPHGFGFQFFIGRRNPRGPATRPNQYPVINSVNVSDAEITLPCPPGTSSTAGGCNDSTSVSVTTNATDPDNDPLTYQYTVSGGTVTGTGANVTWDLSGVRAGTYTLSVAVDDGCGVCGQPATREVRVVECPDCAAPPVAVTPVCPTGLDVTASPSVVNVGETATFTATFANTPAGAQTPRFSWSVSGGEVVGDTTGSTITVRATTAGTNITATANTTFDAPECQATDSATVEVPTRLIPTEIDRYGRLNRNAEKARLDNVAVAAQGDPNARVFIYATGRTRAAADRRLQFARTYLVNTRGIDPGRIVVVNNGVGAEETIIYLVPAGAPEPTPAGAGTTAPQE